MHIHSDARPNRSARPRAGSRLALLMLVLLATVPELGPARILLSALHEAAHGLAVLLSGGRILELSLWPGAASVVAEGGWPPMVWAVGYAAPIPLALALRGAGPPGVMAGSLLLLAGIADVLADALSPASDRDAAQLAAWTHSPTWLWWLLWLALLVGALAAHRSSSPISRSSGSASIQ